MSEAFIEAYRQWLTGEAFDDETRAELRAIENDEAEIEDRFYKELEFGTAGLRGVLGAGTNRMNIYTVGKVTQGLCDMVLDDAATGSMPGAVTQGTPGAVAQGTPGADAQGAQAGAQNMRSNAQDAPAALSIVIAYDPRHKSVEFAEECARIIAANGIHAYLFDDVRPTPELSYAVRTLGCAAGIMITASHNPSRYNGYKVYGADGAQMSVEDSDRVAGYASRLDGYTSIKKTEMVKAYKAGLLTVIGSDVDDSYIERVRTLSLRLPELEGGAEEATPAEEGVLSRFKLIYTPLHGTGNRLVRRALRENGYKNVIVVPQQELPDPEFSTVKSPNPDNREAFTLAIELAVRLGVDIIIGSDPDCDRIGVAALKYGSDAKGAGPITADSYEVLTGNQIGCLLMEYILAARRDAGTLVASRAFVVKSIVTTKLANLIAAYYGVEIIEVYTGFKYICKTVKDLDEFGDKEFIFGFEESNGFLAGNFVRDKDGVIASMLVAEMAAWHSMHGRTLAGALKEIYERYGYTEDAVVSYTLEGKEGLERIASAMASLRAERPSAFGGFGVKVCKDYLSDEVIDTDGGVTGRTAMPERANVLAYQMTDGSVFQIRPSGTEPKIKVYYGVTDATPGGAKKLLLEFESAVSGVVKQLLGI